MMRRDRSQAPDETVALRDPPGAPRMAAIAFLAQNGAIGFMFGSFGLLLVPVEAKLHILRYQSALGMPLVLVGAALMAPLVGALSGRISIRLLMMTGALLGALGYALLAVASSVTLYLAAYALLIGPGLCLTGTVTPATLVTRWFDAGRGRALGIVHVPLGVALVPLLCAWMLRRHGLEATYLVLAAGMAALILPLLFVIDHPPGGLPSDAGLARETGPAAPAGTTAFLGSPVFWALAIGSAAINTGGTVLATHLPPMVVLWGNDRSLAAGLLAIMALSGIAGSLLFGWIADRIGGSWALVLNCADQAVLWTLLLLAPPFPLLAVLIGLIGAHSGAAIVTFSMALAERFGQASFGRAFGLSTLVTLPLLVAGVPMAAWIFVRTGGYAGAIIAQAGFYLTGSLLTIVTRRQDGAPPSPDMAEA